MPEAELAIIGGSGFYAMEGLAGLQEYECDTPFGVPSDKITLGEMNGAKVAFLARHGAGHRLLPGEVPSRANVFALKSLGVKRIISVNAVGSLREELAPRHLVIPDQLIDRTISRPRTFFGAGLVAHVAFAEPFCRDLSLVLAQSAREAGATVHEGGTVVVIEGPQFSTKAESNLYRSWGAHLIGMTNLPEARLAREAEVCYASLACVTDYDVWMDRYDSVTAEMILDNFRFNITMAQEVVRLAATNLPRERSCACAEALSDALVTPAHLVSDELKRELQPIIGKYMPVEGPR